EVINMRDVVTFQGKTVEEVQQAFQDSVDDYLAFCAERGESPDKPYSGQFVTRLDPELHRQISVAASLAKLSLNTWVKEQLQNAVASLDIYGTGGLKTRSQTTTEAPKGRAPSKVVKARVMKRPRSKKHHV